VINLRDELYEEYWNTEKKKKITCECGKIICRAYLQKHKQQSNIFGHNFNIVYFE
jgi:hypothetical protein